MALEHPGYPRSQPEVAGEDVRTLNWARNATIAPAGSVAAPTTEDELRELLASTSGAVRMIGSRMSPGRLLGLDDGGTLLDVNGLSGLISLTDDTATFAGATPLSDVYAVLSAEGKMLPSSPGVIAAQTLAGAISTGTHGQGLQQSSIADAALMIRLVLADGSVREFERDDPWFPAVQLGLGSLGVITRVTLRTEPSPIYTCVKSATSADSLDDELQTWNRENDLVKAWWFPKEGQVQVWAAQHATDDEVAEYRAGGSRLVEHATVSNTMNETIDQTLRQLRDDTKVAVDDKPSRTVTRFRDFTDVTGDIYQVFCRGIATPQINVEIGIPLDLAGGVIKKIKDWHDVTKPRMHYPVILRCTGASEAWLSPSNGQDTCYFGFVVYYSDDGSLSAEGQDFLRAVEKLLAAEGGRPHWGKYFDESLYDWPALYPQWESFRQVREALDPDHRFANAFTAGLFA